MNAAWPLTEHMRRATWVWDNLHGHMQGADYARRDAILHRSLRKQAIRYAPLYPIIEAERGPPWA